MFVSKSALEPAHHVRLSAWLEHAPFAFWLMEQLQPRTVVELGTHNGFSFFSLCQAVKKAGLPSKVFAIDTWQGDEHSGFYGEDVLQSVKDDLDRDYPEIGVMIRSTFQEARVQFADGSVDLLHIDGRHRYEDVAADFETWKSALSDKAVVLFHDTQVQAGGFGVWQFWSEIAQTYPSFEFLHCNGLGVIAYGQAIPEAVKTIFNTDPDEKMLIRSLYARLGAVNSAEYQLSSVHEQIQELGRKIMALNAAVQSKSDAVEILDYKLKSETELRKFTEKKISQLQPELDAAYVRIGVLDQAIASMTSSASWKITKPYRVLSLQVWRVKRIATAIRSLARQHGGYITLASRAAAILRREGVQGALSSWRYANAVQGALGRDGAGRYTDYSAWLESYAGLDDGARAKITAEIANWVERPVISIIMPVYNPPLDLVEAAIQSVQSQLYPRWELCIADDASTVDGLRALLDRYAASDTRIKIIYREKNGHISEASNSAISLASGEWMALFDQDDLLTEDALFYVAREITRRQDVKLIYSDEDKTDGQKRFDPYFKPDWNPDLLRSHNLVCHLGVYKTDRVRDIGGFRKGLEGAQDHDLVLRFAEGLQPNEIAHIPRVLYHWRSHSGSTAQSADNKSYAVIAGQKAIQEHVDRLGARGSVEILPTNMYRVKYDLPEELPLVSIVIPTRNGVELLRQCITSVFEKTTYKNYEIIVVDNNSDDPRAHDYFKRIAEFPNVQVIRDERPFNYSALNNDAVAQAQGDFVLLMNNDIEVIAPDWLSEMVGLGLQKGVGAVGARLWYPDDRLQHGGVILGIGGVAGHSHKFLAKAAHGYFSRGELTQTLSAVTAACLLIRKSIYLAVGGLDEENLKVAFNDVDFCLKVREAGYRNVWTPYAELYHHESATRGNDDTPEKKERFRSEVLYMLDRWKDELMFDPAYNPNLTLDREDFSYAWPPRNEGDTTLAS